MTKLQESFYNYKQTKKPRKIKIDLLREIDKNVDKTYSGIRSIVNTSKPSLQILNMLHRLLIRGLQDAGYREDLLEENNV